MHFACVVARWLRRDLARQIPVAVSVKRCQVNLRCDSTLIISSSGYRFPEIAARVIARLDSLSPPAVRAEA